MKTRRNSYYWNVSRAHLWIQSNSMDFMSEYYRNEFKVRSFGCRKKICALNQWYGISHQIFKIIIVFLNWCTCSLCFSVVWWRALHFHLHINRLNYFFFNDEWVCIMSTLCLLTAYVNWKPVFKVFNILKKKPIFSKPNMCMHLKYLFAVLIYSWFSHYLSHTIRKLSSVQGACFFQIIIIIRMRDFVIQFNRLQPSIIHEIDAMAR